MFTIKSTLINGCYEIQPKIHDDFRGRFVKLFNDSYFKKFNLNEKFSELYYSKSNKGVLRGMHFQKPPFDHVKLVTCTHGEVLDVVLDIRKNSPTFGKSISFILSGDHGNIAYLEKGLAHGFYVKSEEATLIYSVSTIYSNENDCGIHWNSFNFNWPTSQPIISDRDANFLNFSEFDSPFSYV